MTKENAWKILNHKCTLPEAMKIFGRTDQEIKEKIDDLNSRQNTFSYFGIANMYASLSYDFLVEQEEIDGTKMFNMHSASFDKTLNRHADIGKMNGKKYRYNYTKNEWEAM